MIPLFKVNMSAEAVKNAQETLTCGQIAEGPKVKKFEKKLEEKLKDKVLTTNSCTSALTLAYDVIKLEDEGQRTKVLATPLTCAASNFAIIHNGLTPVWCDIDRNNLCVNINDIALKLTKDTLAISLTMWAGNSFNFDDLMYIVNDFERKYNKPLHIVVDCAHKFNPVEADAYRAFSFQAIKFLNVGSDGGALQFPESWYHQNQKFLDYYEIAKKKRWFGLDRDKGGFRSSQDIEYIGFKYHLSDTAASIGLGNIKLAEEKVNLHKRNAKFYSEKINNKYIKLLPFDENSDYWLYTVIVNGPTSYLDSFTKYMKNNGVETNPTHSRNDKYKIFRKLTDEQYLPNMNSIEGKYTNIPVGCWAKEASKIVEIINRWSPKS